ncbi:Sialoadhesin [Nibea albiflora]|uniref:Sialoadhesin n=1 Tax=Nibea albiflora TaxID=240163 RepID=A0ACB7FK99_NIBAL|nr:Sialoadhesin [Nibea albiflora]
MRGAAMSLTAAASGFVVFLLSVSVSANSFTPLSILNICVVFTLTSAAARPQSEQRADPEKHRLSNNEKCSHPVIQGQNDWGVTYTSTEICAFKGSTVNISCNYKYPTTKYGPVQKTLWFTNSSNNDFVDLKTDSEYSGRVQYICDNNKCTLRITDLRESDSAEYRFRFTTENDGKYFGTPGVHLSVTDVPRVEPVSVSPSGEIVENSSVTLTCSSDANPAAHYAWYKKNGGPDLHPLSNEAELVFRSIQSSDSGEKKRAPKAEERPGNREQGQLEEQGDLQYADIQFSNNQADSLYSNTGAAQPLRHMEQQAVVEYDAVKFNSA